MTELDTKCSPPFSPSAFASTKLTKNDTKHIPEISVRLSVNNVLAKNWSTFRQMQTLDKVSNFSLNHGIKLCIFCFVHCIQFSRLEAGHFPSLLPSKFSSLQFKFLNCFQLTGHFVIKSFKNREKKRRKTRRYKILVFCMNKEQTDPLSSQEKHLQQ